MSVFDEFERTDHRPATHTEASFSFLNRSAWPEADQIRALIEAWVTHYPPEDRPSLIGRLRSEFDATFFELFLHELLLQFGCHVTVHPPTPDLRGTRPDFLARFPSGEQVFVEAVLATDLSDSEGAQRSRLGMLYDEINKVESPNFFIRLERVAPAKSGQPSGRRLRAFIERQIAIVDPDAVAEAIERDGLRGAPSWSFREGEFELVFSVVPKSPAGRGKPGRAIGIYPTETRWGDSSAALKGAILRKATKYGILDCPYVIAVNATGIWGIDRIDVMQALFGTEVLYLNGEEEPRPGRMPDGAWHGPAGPQNTRVSAVLAASVVPWNLSNAPLCLYHNPFGAHPCVTLPWRVARGVPGDGKMLWLDGAPTGELLGLLSAEGAARPLE